MKQKFFFAVLLLMVAGRQSALAQKVVLNYTNGKTLRVSVAELKDISFEEAGEFDYGFVDLGLPSGTLWATCNVGASTPEESGDYFVWGETETKSDYSWSTYKWMTPGQSSSEQINKYTVADNQTSACWYSNGMFIGDGITELESADDAATNAWAATGRCRAASNSRNC